VIGKMPAPDGVPDSRPPILTARFGSAGPMVVSLQTSGARPSLAEN